MIQVIEVNWLSIIPTKYLHKEATFINLSADILDF